MQFCGSLFARAATLLIFMLASSQWPAAHAQSGATSGAEPAGGPIRLRQPQQAPQAPAAPTASAAPPGSAGLDDTRVDATERTPRYRPGEFELYIQGVTGDINTRRFGSEFVIDAASARSLAQDTSPAVPADYKVAPGDELLVSIWGSVDADLRLIVDRTGRVNIPRVGSVVVSGLQVPDVGTAIERQARRVFKNFELSVSLGQLRNVRVFVTGFAVRPGAYTVSSLSTLSTVVFGRSGGPSASGSFRDIELRRAGRTVAKLDLYDLMLFGRRDADQPIQADDVIHIGPIGRQVALIGSVNKPAIFEVRDSETLSDLLRMGGGFNSVADRSRVAVERVSERNDRRVRQLALPADAAAPLDAGDLVRTFSAIDAALPLQRQNKRVRVEGEVQRPGTFILPPESTVADALKMAGGLTPAAYLFGTEFNRESVRLSQQTNYERALRDIELELSRKSTATGVRTSDEAAAQAQQQLASERLLTRLRESRPSGRVVLQLPIGSTELPNLAMEDGDRIFVPARPSTVGVFGSVFNAGSYLFNDSRKVDDYLRLAGSPTRGADKTSIFVVRANGSVISAQQGEGGWFGVGSTKINELTTLPGDTIFVPEESNKTTFLQNAKDWTQVLYQLGLGLAAIKVILP
jgi:protein involved in polysaccharide export with SLBB domain